MSDSFQDISKSIADEYLQSIIFIDDEVYTPQNDQNHRLDQEQISSSFFKQEKLCAIYNPKSEGDLEQLISISKKADIVVLDWNINLVTEEEEVNDEEDEEEVDPRGVHTINMISDILFDEDNNISGLKVIVIYTGETGLSEHRDRVFEKISSIDNSAKKEGDFIILSSSYRVSIISKESTTKKHISKELKQRIVSFNDLPNFVLEEFTSLTNGLLSNFALKSLAEIRANSNKILNLFSKELDPAYLSHKALITNKEDANELLIELIKDAFGSILRYRNVNTLLNDDLIELWLKENIEEKEKPILAINGDETTKKYTRSIEFLTAVLQLTKHTDKEFKAEYEKLMNVTKSGNFWILHNTSFFSDLSRDIISQINTRFAILSHHKSLYKPLSNAPVLSLGTVVHNSSNFFVCIQQRCDSVRVLENEERRFLFISLIETDGGGFDFITPNGKKLKVDNKSYSLRTVKFKGDNEGLVKAELNEGKFYFMQKYQDETDDKFEWIFDLKDLHAQRIISNYSFQLNRVGLDETEWLRRS